MSTSNLPRHIAIIMDGNGRWATKRRLPKILGHRQGMESLKRIMEHCRKLGVKVLTVYAFSTENWKRPKNEVNALMGFIGEYIDREIENLKKDQTRFNCIGRIDTLPERAQEKIRWAMDQTKDCSRLVFNAAINYGGRTEIVDAVNKIIAAKEKKIDESSFNRFLYTEDLPDPDLLIRTSGEVRISNFLLWQASYSEFYFTEKLWPDFKAQDLDKAIEEYQRRQRRFGGSK